MLPQPMNLRILQPFGVFAEKSDVTRMVVETSDGSYGFLPHRLDCVLVLTPGILTYETSAGGEVFVAVDEGVLVKAGLEVLVSVRGAISGSDLSQLRALVDQEFLTLDEQEESANLVMKKLETGFLQRFASFQHE